MSNVLIYWIIGCFIVGAATASTLAECPTKQYTAQDMAAKIAIWPAFLAMAITAKPPLSLTACNTDEASK